MGIIRVSKDSNFVVMNRTALNDDRLSWKAKGIMAYMLSMPNDWTFYLDELQKHATDGKDSLRSGFNELKKYGYIKRYPVKDPETKRIVSWETVVVEMPNEVEIEKPDTEFPHMEKPEVEKPLMENPPLLNTDINQVLNKPNTDNKKDMSSKELDSIPYKEIVDYLNLKTGKKFKHSTNKTRKDIKSRWNEGFRLDHFKRVIDIKTSQWLNNPKMNSYLRPETLFGTKFEGYLNEKEGVNSGAYRQVAQANEHKVDLGF